MTNVFSSHKMKLVNLISKLAENNDKIYSFNISKCDISVQMRYCTETIKFLKTKKFNYYIHDNGFITFSKKYGSIMIRLVITD